MAKMAGKIIQITTLPSDEEHFAVVWCLTDTGKVYHKTLTQAVDEWEEETLEVKE